MSTERRKVPTVIHLPIESHEKLRKIAKKQRRSISSLGKSIIEEFLEIEEMATKEVATKEVGKKSKASHRGVWDLVSSQKERAEARYDDTVQSREK